jgi:hypothetical protein
MSDKSNMATEEFLSGYNCAQSVLVAFCEETGVSDDMALKISCGLGGGMGLQGQVFRKAPILRLEFGLDTKFRSTSEQNNLYHKRTGRMESNCCKTNVAFERSSGKRVGTLEFWDGDLAFMWSDFCFK